jgi:phosphatidylglycerol---prolipoprotein diacylglyceryl transferase
VTGLLGAIPYTTYPDLEIGPFTLRTFGLFVAIGVLLGAWLAARYAEEHGVHREDTYRLATRMVVGGVIGARLTWVVTHWDSIDSPVDVIAIWEGGLQFSGGFIAAVIIGYPTYRSWTRLQRWNSLDGYAYGLTIGLAIGRIACWSVGEHFGRQSDFFLAVRYEGGSVREPTLGDVRLVEGMTFHNTALYELLSLLVLFVIMTWLLYVRPQRPQPATVIGLFCAWYAVSRFATDLLRVNDNTVLGLTGAQWMTVALAPTAAWILLRVRPQLAAERSSDEAASRP